jgi:hypothetical protein
MCNAAERSFWTSPNHPPDLGLANERNEAAISFWAALKPERASPSARSQRIETKAVPIRYVAELVGDDIDSERAALGRRCTLSNATLVRSTFEKSALQRCRMGNTIVARLALSPSTPRA